MLNIRVALCALGLVGLNAGCSLVAKPQVRDVRARIETIDLNGIDMVFDVDVANPYPFAIRTPQFRYALDIADKQFFGSDRSAEVDLPALGVGTLSLPATITYLNLWNVHLGLRDADEISYRLRGTVFVRAMDRDFELPISYEGTFPVMHLPTFAAPKVRFDDVSLGGATVTLETEIRNPNVFRLGFDKLGLDVMLGDVSVAEVRPSLPDGLDPDASGKLSLIGRIQSSKALRQILGGNSLGTPRITLTGSLQTPYGPVAITRE